MRLAAEAASGAGFGAGAGTNEVTRWKESHQMRRSGWIVAVICTWISMHASNMMLPVTKWPDLDIWHSRRPRSTVPGRIPGRHPNQKTSRPRIGHGKARLMGFRSAPSYFEPHGRGDGSFGKLRGEALFVIGRRDDYATMRRNARMTTTVDDAEVRSNRLT